MSKCLNCKGMLLEEYDVIFHEKTYTCINCAAQYDMRGNPIRVKAKERRNPRGLYHLVDDTKKVY